MATYNPETGNINLAVVRDGEGWTVTIPTWWSIAQIERYCSELEWVS